jgi:AraC-like DNA-binding protein
MRKQHVPIYQIQDFEPPARKDRYFYFNSFAAHLQEHRIAHVAHKHDFYILLFVTQGTGTHTIDFREYEVQPGTVFFIKPGQVHNLALSPDADGSIIFFTQGFYAREYPGKALHDFPFFNAMLYNPMLRLTPHEEASLMPLLHLLKQEYDQARPMRDAILSRYLDILMMELTRIFRPSDDAAGIIGKEQTILQNLERLIDLHYKEHQPVSFYAEHLHITTRHLNDICKQSLGKTTKELILNRLLLEAQRLLVHANLTSSQIAVELGFYDNTYFFRFFKKHAGCTPEQFRAANK